MPSPTPASPARAFATPRQLRAWLAKNSGKVSELWILFHKVGSGRKSVTYPQALDEALAIGWIDGIRKRVDDASYTIRFTPRKKGSYWSTVNIAKARALVAAGRMTPAGLAAFEARDASEARRYSFENRPQDLPAGALAELKRSRAAWAFWQEQPPSYRRAATWFVLSAKKEATRARRLRQLIATSAKRERLAALTSPARRTKAPAPRARSPRR